MKHRAGEKFDNVVIDIPLDQDEFVAKTKLETMNMKLDELSAEQLRYINSYNEGT